MLCLSYPPWCPVADGIRVTGCHSVVWHFVSSPFRAIVRLLVCVLALSITWGLGSVAYSGEEPGVWTDAVARGQMKQLVQLMDRGFHDVDQATPAGKTALMMAARYGDWALSQRLVKSGASVHLSNRKGGTALMYAVVGANSKIVRLCLDQGAEVNAAASNGWTALYLAAAKGYGEIVSLLLSKGADPDVADIYGWTPLMRAVERQRRDVVRLLLDGTAVDVTASNQRGATAAHWAASSGSEEVIVWLAQAGVDLTRLDRDGRSVGDYAREGGFLTLAHRIESGAINTIPANQ